MKYKDIANKIIALKDADIKLRNKLVRNGELGNGYNEEMQRVHDRNAKELDEVIDRIGYPTIDKVGKEGCEAAWLVIQHSIGQPGFMKKCAELLKKLVEEKKGDPVNLAYLTDRIAVFEGRPQLYGTQFDWDEKGELSSQYFEDVEEVNKRRRSIGLNSLQEQTAIMRTRAKSENEKPPQDLEKRKREMEEWKITVGWIK